MKLVFLTQVLDRDDAVLGFVPRWVEGLARHCERVRVLALSVGDVTRLPANVDVREIGRSGWIGRYFRNRRFLKEALERDGFDTVLAHMVPRYTLLSSGIARASGAGQFLWYAHGTVDARLERAVKLVDKVFTASEESLRISSPKRVVTGHGIDLEHFSERGESPARPIRLLEVGRLTPAKDPLTVLAALAILVSRGFDVHLDLVGAGLVASDDAYGRRVQEQIEVGGLQERVVLHGAVPYREIPPLYRRCTMLVSASRTGSVDKVVLEAMACARPVVTCNDSFPRLFRELGADAPKLVFEPGSATSLAEKVEGLLRLRQPERVALGERLRTLVARDHEVDALMKRMVEHMQRKGRSA
ncbi:MAG: glycosyltransferase family 4 protein [Planctomycetaceae bacterium]|nr:glycosyltransferase family 4 protein [Planctomycetaceae bacterium]